MQNVKVVLVGDRAVGKTSLLITYTTREYPTEYIPVIFDSYAYNITVDGREALVGLWDTIADRGESHDRLRPLTYLQANVILICFAIDDPESFEHARTKWYPELIRYCPRVPTVLVGTKLDVRQDEELRLRLKEKSITPVSIADGLRLQREIGAVKYMECSACAQAGIDIIFEEAVRAALDNMQTK